MMKMIPVKVRVRHKTQQAVLVENGATDKDGNPLAHWIPRSQCDFHTVEDIYEEGKALDLNISEWLAKERGLI